MHGLCWHCGDTGGSPWPGPQAVGHPLHTELAEAFTLTVRSKEEGLGFFFSLSS